MSTLVDNVMDAFLVVATVAFGIGLDKRDVGAVMLTLLTRLELGEVQHLHSLSQLNVNCTLNFHKTALTFLADKDKTVAAILNKSQTKQGQYVFDIPNVVDSIGDTAIDVSNQLLNLKARKLDAMFSAAVFAVNVCEKMHCCDDSQHTPCMQKKILDYFKGDNSCDVPNKTGQGRCFYRVTRMPNFSKDNAWHCKPSPSLYNLV